MAMMQLVLHADGAWPELAEAAKRNRLYHLPEGIHGAPIQVAVLRGKKAEADKPASLSSLAMRFDLGCGRYLLAEVSAKVYLAIARGVALVLAKELPDAAREMESMFAEITKRATTGEVPVDTEICGIRGTVFVDEPLNVGETVEIAGKFLVESIAVQIKGCAGTAIANVASKGALAVYRQSPEALSEVAANG